MVPTAKRGPVFGLRPADGEGAFTADSERVAWTLSRGTPDVPSPMVLDGLVYLSGERGTLTVLESVGYEEVHVFENRIGRPVRIQAARDSLREEAVSA